MGVTGKEITIARNDGVQSCGNIVQLVESPKNPGVLYAGTDDGKVHMTRDGKTWTDITSRFRSVPANAYVSRLTASAHDVNVVYATFDNHRADDYGTFIYASVDGGNNFRSIGEGIPKGRTITAMAEDPKNPSVLCSARVRVVRQPRSRRSGGCASSNLLTVPIHEIVIHPRDNDMIVATHGKLASGFSTTCRRCSNTRTRRRPMRSCSTCAAACSSTRQRSRLRDRQALLRRTDLWRGDRLLPVEAADQRGTADSRCVRHASP